MKMLELAGLLIPYGLIDSLNPSTIATVLVLLPLVKKQAHTGIFIWGTFIIYLSLGLMSYYGFNAYLKIQLIRFYHQYQTLVLYAALVTGVSLLVFFLYKLYGFVQNSPAQTPAAKALNFKSVHPGFLFGLAFATTVKDFPTALPYFWFMGVAVKQDLQVGFVLFWLSIYCLIYISPMLLLYVSYSRYKSKFAKVEAWVQQATGKAIRYGLPGLALIAGIWLVYSAATKLF
jgi:cytochrome c biogenesis protein CcdA